MTTTPATGLLLTEDEEADFVAQFKTATGIDLGPAEQATLFPCDACGCLFWPDQDGGTWWPDRLQPMTSFANGLAPNCNQPGTGIDDPGCPCHSAPGHLDPEGPHVGDCGHQHLIGPEDPS